ncbi:hypothetical protein HY989_06235 [Candidatus Micrarchaeota archaeon]|nr:hypothetical protein [Candidatus Micrarchaeota archaeon]
MDTDIYPRWNGKVLIPTRSAQEEMDFEGFDLRQIAESLDMAIPCGKHRKEGIFELCFEKNRRKFKIVIAESFGYFRKEQIYLIIHVKGVK